MPDLTEDLRRYGAALTTRVEPVDVDAIIAGVSRSGRRVPTGRAVVLAVAAALVIVAVTVALLTTRPGSTGIETVGQPDGPQPTTQDRPRRRRVPRTRVSTS